MKFKDIEYKRPDTDAEVEALHALADGSRNAKSYGETPPRFAAAAG